MKALATCPHCNGQIETDCEHCIEGKIYGYCQCGIVARNVN